MRLSQRPFGLLAPVLLGPRAGDGVKVSAIERSRKFIAGDPLRALAALLVLGFHCFVGALLVGAVPADPEAAFGTVGTRALGSLDLGLFIFFVLSGYLIGRPFLLAFVEGSPLPDVGGYLRNRLLRIVPPLWGVFTVILVTHPWLDSDAHEVAAVYGFLQRFFESEGIEKHFSQGWTLGVEMAFYLLVPLVAVAAVGLLGGRLGRRGRLRAVWTALALTAVASLVARGAGPSSQEHLEIAPTTLFAFVPGLALATLEATPRRWARRSSPAPLALLGLAAALLVGYAAVRGEGDDVLEGLLVAGGTGALVGAALVREWSGERPWRVLDNRVLHWIGQRSYSLYLVHVAVLVVVLDALEGQGPRRALAVLAVVGGLASLAAAAVSHRLLEQPFLRRRSRYRQRAEAQAEVSQASA